MDKVTGVALGLRLAVVFTIAATFSSYSKAAEPIPSAVTLTRIVIDDNWGGLNPTSPHRSHWVIEPRGSGYVVYGKNSRRRMASQANGSWTEERDVTNVAAQPVSGTAVDALVRALQAPPQNTVDPTVFGAEIRHADKKIDEMVQELTALNPPPALRQRILDWGNGLRQGQPLAQAITVGVTTSFHTDDYPSTRIEANFANGSSLVFSSGSQNLFLLPWSDASGHKSYSAALPKALAAVLPPMSSNRQRLAAEPSQDELDDYVETGMGNDYARFQVQIVAPQAYATLASRFTISEINPVDIASHQLFVTVSLPGGPSNLSLRTQLAIEGQALAKPSDLDGMMAALNTAATATGLHQAMLTAPKDDFRIEHGIGMQSFQAAAKKQFIAQMTEAHKLPELARHPQLLDGAVMVTQGGDPTYWVALHDRRAVVWKRYVGSTPSPGHRLCANVPASDESYGSLGNSDECLGEVYDAAGKAL
jgi:hypothetical protein